MKTLRSTLLTLLAIMFTAAVSGQARLQVIHNSADEAASVVDVWLNDVLLIDDFEFRTATPFIDAPAGEEFNIYIKGPDSDAKTEPVATFDFFLEDGQTYIIVANGIVSPTGYNPAQAFDLFVYDMGREASTVGQNTDILVFHGATDAPVVDIQEVAVPAGLIVDDLDYSDFAGYLELPTANYSLQVRDMYSSTVVAQYGVPLEELGTFGQALTVVASGFLNPASNSNGPAFGLWAATAAGGDLIPLPVEPISTARAQIVHNSADQLAKVVDIYVNDALFVDDLGFRTATPYVDVPAGVELEIDILPFNSTSADNPVATFNVAFEGGEVYQVIANGLINPDGYTPFQPFNLYVYDMAREYASMMSNTDVLVFHGSTDAPVVDVVEVAVGAGTIVDDLAYTDFQGYLELPQADFSLQLRDQTGTDIIAQYRAPIAGLGLAGQALSIVASGFINPSVNSDGPAFGLYVALPSGGDLIPLPQENISTARVQVIHNSADPGASVVDVWLNGEMLIDNFEFRTATPFIDAPADRELQISILPPNSVSADNPVATFDFVLEGAEKYILIANGLITPENEDVLFNLYPYAPAREMAQNAENVDVLIFHGSTDAPAVDLFEVTDGSQQVWNDLEYSDFTGYLPLPVDNYSLQIRDASGTNKVAQYALPLETYNAGGQAVTIVASGFLAPVSAAQAQFGLWAALPTGGALIELPQEQISTARVQVIHNSADQAAETVDVWLNGEMLIDDFMFRTATPFVDVPANENIEVAIQPANSTSAENPLASFTYNLMGGEKYILVANGIVSPSGYDPSVPFDIWVFPGAREMATEMSNTDVMVFHGSTDAPTVDVFEVAAGAGLIIDDLMYGDFRGYLELPTDYYSLQIRDESGTQTVATYNAPLSGLGLDGYAISVLASGFLNPSANSDGADFGLWVALPSGGELIELPSLLTGLEEESLTDEAFNLYPNPAVNTLNVQFTSKLEQNVTVDVFNLVGTKVYSKVISAQKDETVQDNLDVSGLTSGMYILRISNGADQLTEKFKVFK